MPQKTRWWCNCRGRPQSQTPDPQGLQSETVFSTDSTGTSTDRISIWHFHVGSITNRHRYEGGSLLCGEWSSTLGVCEGGGGGNGPWCSCIDNGTLCRLEVSEQMHACKFWNRSRPTYCSVEQADMNEPLQTLPKYIKILTDACDCTVGRLTHCDICHWF